MKNGIFVIFVVMLFFIGCKKDPSLICNPLPESGGLYGWNYVLDSNYCEAPYFNPNNSNEFAFLKRTGAGSVLCKYNISTGIITKLYTGAVFYRPSWGVNDWILFNVSNDIYKIKSSGDSLTRLTTNGVFLRENWTPTATEYTYSLYSGAGYTGVLVASANGQIVDSFGIDPADTATWVDSTLIFVNAGNTKTGFIVYGGGITHRN